jgi:hypothetical protein
MSAREWSAQRNKASREKAARAERGISPPRDRGYALSYGDDAVNSAVGDTPVPIRRADLIEKDDSLVPEVEVEAIPKLAPFELATALSLVADVEDADIDINDDEDDDENDDDSDNDENDFATDTSQVISGIVRYTGVVVIMYAPQKLRCVSGSKHWLILCFLRYSECEWSPSSA